MGVAVVWETQLWPNWFLYLREAAFRRSLKGLTSPFAELWKRLGACPSPVVSCPGYVGVWKVTADHWSSALLSPSPSWVEGRTMPAGTAPALRHASYLEHSVVCWWLRVGLWGTKCPSCVVAPCEVWRALSAFSWR